MPQDYTQFERERIRDIAYRKRYAEYLQSYNWDYYLTVTFRKDWRDTIHAKDSVAEALLTQCHVERAFLAVENSYHPERRVHIHGLVAGYHKFKDWSEFYPGMLLPWDMWKQCFTRFGRSQVVAINSMEDVSMYCSKYVVKQRTDYGFYGRKEFWQKGLTK